MSPQLRIYSQIALAFTLINVTSGLPRSDNCSCDDSNSDSWLFLGLHVIGMLFSAIASGLHKYNADSHMGEYVAYLGLYGASAITISLSLYVTYRFSSPDMLLITTTLQYYIAQNSYRPWPMLFREFHSHTPMWRTYNGMVFKRMWRKPLKDEVFPNQTLQQSRREKLDWNGEAYSSRLWDHTEAIFVEEIDKMRWEKSQVLWKDFMKQVRSGVGPAKHAVAALRMAYSIPVPVRICVGTREYYSVRGTKGTEVAKIWGVPQRELEQLKFFTVKHGKRYVECERREDIAMLLHIKLAREDPQQPNNNRDEWYQYMFDWLGGEVFVGNLPLPGDVIDNDDENTNQESRQMFEQSIHLQNALAYGKIHKCPQGAPQYWYLLKRDDATQFMLERAPSWHIENAQITKRHRRPLRSEELQHPSLDGNAFRDELLDGTEIRLEWEAETEYWELTDDNWLQLRSTMNEYAGNKDDGGGLSIVKAALRAYRMTRSIPFPVTVRITDEEVAALRQDQVEALSTAWKVPPDDISNMKCLCERDGNGAYEFHEEDRLDLGKVLQVKSVLYNEKAQSLELNCFGNLFNRRTTSAHEERESTSEAIFFEWEWMFGELLFEFDNDKTALEDTALAYGSMGGSDSRKWFLFSHEAATEIAKKRSEQRQSTNVIIP